MRLYPSVPSLLARTVARDLLLVAALALFAWLGLKVHDVVDQLAALGHGIQSIGDHVPLVGGSISDLGREGESSVHSTANLLGWLTFGIPAALVLWNLLPGRIDQVRRLTAAAKVLREPLEPERRRLLAMRAAFSLPYGQLLRFTRDPLGDLEAGRYEPLVAAALEDAGLRPTS